MPTLRPLVLVLALLLAPAASATPVVRSANLTLSVSLNLAPSAVVSLTSAASVSVDETARTIAISAGALAGTAPTVPVTSTTSVAGIRLRNLSNLTATFAIGGAATFETPCPGGAAPGQACAAGLGLGGGLEFSGFFDIIIVPGLATYAIPFVTTPAPTVNLAAFTRFTGYAQTTGTGSPQITQYGSTSAAANVLNMVSPMTFLSGARRTLTLEFTDGGGLPTFVNATIPEPASAALIAAGALGLAGLRRTRPRA